MSNMGRHIQPIQINNDAASLKLLAKVMQVIIMCM